MSGGGDAQVQALSAISHGTSRRNLHWCMKDVEVDAVCNAGFSDPPDEDITPFKYFREICRDEVIENFIEQSSLHCTENRKVFEHE